MWSHDLIDRPTPPVPEKAGAEVSVATHTSMVTPRPTERLPGELRDGRFGSGLSMGHKPPRPIEEQSGGAVGRGLNVFGDETDAEALLNQSPGHEKAGAEERELAPRHRDRIPRVDARPSRSAVCTSWTRRDAPIHQPASEGETAGMVFAKRVDAGGLSNL